MTTTTKKGKSDAVSDTALAVLTAAGFTNACIHVTGESDTGKTLFALQSGASPEETVFIDADVKGKATVRQLTAQGLTWGLYHDLVTETDGMKEVAYHNYCIAIMDEIAGLPPASRRVIVWDTWEPLEKTLKAVVSSDPKRFRDFYSPMGTIKGAEEWLASFDYEAELINRLVSLCDFLILVTHVKPYNVGGRRVEGKVVSDNKRPLVQKSLLRIWLKHNPKSPVPIGLVMKRLGKTSYVPGVGIRTENVLPRKITPRPWRDEADVEDSSLWDTILHYWKNPIGGRTPESHERPDEFELSILDGTLTEDQRMILQAAIQTEKEEESIFAPLRKGRAAEIYAETGSYKAVAEEFEVTIPEAMALVKGEG